MRLVAGLLLALMNANGGFAAEPTYEQWAAQGALLQRAFNCAALAEHAQKYDEANRLFSAALDIGRPLVEGVFAGRIKPRNDLDRAHGIAGQLLRSKC
jgi:hypothetical protein